MNRQAFIITSLLFLLAGTGLRVAYAQAPLTVAHNSSTADYLGNRVSLIGTAIVNADGHRSMAVIEDKETHAQQIITAGEALHGFVIKHIRRQYIVLAVQGKEYRLYAVEGLLDAPKTQAEDSPFDAIYKTATRQNLRVSREAIKHASDDLHNFLRQSTFYPFYKDGKPAGFMIRGIQKDSFLEKIGFQENDIIQHIGGQSITDMDDWVMVYDWVMQKERIEVGLLRGGGAFKFEYEIAKSE